MYCNNTHISTLSIKQNNSSGQVTNEMTITEGAIYANTFQDMFLIMSISYYYSLLNS